MAVFKPKYFATTLDSFAKQVVPPSMYDRWGVQALDKMDQRILEFIDDFRHHVGVPLMCNDWSWGGNFSQSGVRDVKFYGSYEKMEKSRSDHICGKACDVRSSKMTGHELRLKFIEREEYYFDNYGINFIECGKLGNGSDQSWFHGSINIDLGQGVQYWSPKYGFVNRKRVIEEKL